MPNRDGKPPQTTETDKQPKDHKDLQNVHSTQPRRNSKPITSCCSDQEKITIIERIPYIDGFCLIFGLRCGTMWIGITGIILGCVSFLAYLILIGRSELDVSTVLLLLLLALFALVTILFIVGSVLLIIAACCENPEFIPAYIWICIIYWVIQMILGILIPIVLLLEGGQSILIALIWSCFVMILGLLWTHYLAVVKSYMWILYDEGCHACP